jgi:hypothetical protein
MEYYSSTKKNEIKAFAGKWMEIIMLNEISQTQKTKISHFLSYADSGA